MIPAGEETGTGTFSFAPVDDDLDEDDGETVTVAGTAAPSGATVNGAVLTIVDDDDVPALLEPMNVITSTDVDTRWRGLDLSFDVLDEAVVENTQYRIRRRDGGAWSGWETLADVEVVGGRVRGSTQASLGIGTVYDVQVRGVRDSAERRGLRPAVGRGRRGEPGVTSRPRRRRRRSSCRASRSIRCLRTGSLRTR